MIRVVYDYQIFAAQRFGGISRYFCALASELDRLPDVTARIVAPLHINGHLQGVSRRVAIAGLLPGRLRSERLSRHADRLLFPPLAAGLRPDVVHETYFAAAPTSGGRAPRVLTMFDMIHERFPEQFAAAGAVAAEKAAALRRAAHVVCISHSARRDLLEAHDLPEERVTVVHLGYDRLEARGCTAEGLVGEGPYLLHVGTRNGYKNFAQLARAVAASPWLRANFRLVCFGGGAFSPDERALLAALGLGERQVVQLGGGDDRLAALYAGAAAFVYPSRYEGFGIPLLEAMSLGCPVVCSDTSSLPEVAEDAAEYFAPDDVGAIAGAIERVLQDSARRATLVARGEARCRRFSWARCAGETRAVYEALLA